MAQINLDSYTSVRSSFFIRWEIDEYRSTPTGSFNNTTLTFTDHLEEITINFDDVGDLTFTPVGKLLNMTSTTSGLRGNSNELSFRLSGIPNTEIGSIIHSNLKGSVVKIYRGFFDSTTGTQIGLLQGRFFGYVNSFGIDETYDYYGKDQTVSLNIDCNSFLKYFDVVRNARRTNPTSMQAYFPTDTSFNRTPGLVNQSFDFGKPRTDGFESVPTIIEILKGFFK
jgi:hypothetical protein